jgi:hypothetical protein
MKLASVLFVVFVIAVSADEYHPKHNRPGAYENRAVVDGKLNLVTTNFFFLVLIANMIFRCCLLEQDWSATAPR